MKAAAGEQQKEISQELKDIEGILSIAENTDRNIQQSIESILRMAQRHETRRDKEGKKDELVT
jgi:hypothetical protein